MSRTIRDYRHQNSKMWKRNKFLLEEEHNGLFKHPIDGLNYELNK